MSLSVIYCLFKKPPNKIVQLRGNAEPDTIAKMKQIEIAAKVTFKTKLASGLLADVPLIVNSALASESNFEPEVAQRLIKQYPSKLSALEDDGWQDASHLCDLDLPTKPPGEAAPPRPIPSHQITDYQAARMRIAHVVERARNAAERLAEDYQTKGLCPGGKAALEVAREQVHRTEGRLNKAEAYEDPVASILFNEWVVALGDMYVLAIGDKGRSQITDIVEDDAHAQEEFITPEGQLRLVSLVEKRLLPLQRAMEKAAKDVVKEGLLERQFMQQAMPYQAMPYQAVPYRFANDRFVRDVPRDWRDTKRPRLARPTGHCWYWDGREGSCRAACRFSEDHKPGIPSPAFRLRDERAEGDARPPAAHYAAAVGRSRPN